MPEPKIFVIWYPDQEPVTATLVASRALLDLMPQIPKNVHRFQFVEVDSEDDLSADKSAREKATTEQQPGNYFYDIPYYPAQEALDQDPEEMVAKTIRELGCAVVVKWQHRLFAINPKRDVLFHCRKADKPLS